MHVANIIRKYQGLCPNHPAATVCPMGLAKALGGGRARPNRVTIVTKA